nr:MAG TPA: hypothetical protein [Caudoviricetes sp.]
MFIYWTYILDHTWSRIYALLKRSKTKGLLGLLEQS